MEQHTQLSASDAARAIASGEIKSVDLVTALVRQIAAREPEVQAFVHFDAEYTLQQARTADLAREEGRELGPLHGVPVALKDIIDTQDMPTEHGSALFAGRTPGADASVVNMLRQAGAVILGKTVTAELAVLHPGKTRNPHNLAHTPGGSSSGSAAAVAAHMAPLALGTQTNGSVIRPASFCGVYGYKPSFGLISRYGVLEAAPSLDTVGVFGRSIEDLALAADCMSDYDSRDAGMWMRSRAPMRPVAMSEPPIPPTFAFVKTPVWYKAGAQTQEAFLELADALGERCTEVVLEPGFDHATSWLRTIMLAEIARSYGRLYDEGRGQMSAVLCASIEEGRSFTAVDYLRAKHAQNALYTMLENVFEGFDAILTPPATGPAPLGRETTGDPVFCTLWSLLGVPNVSLPLLEVDGLPLGVQVIGQRRDDARLLRAARWLERHLQSHS
ncbi:MAG: amidase [Chitinophagales bacterium]|nr:amidase [Hyphomicrobiales bacterium]